MEMKFTAGMYYPIEDVRNIRNELDNIYNGLFQNKSGITRNITEPELPKVSPHWPGVGRYIGMVNDEKPVLFTYEGFNHYDYWDKQPWQKNRIYGDEIELKNNPYSNLKCVKFDIKHLDESIYRMEKFIQKENKT